MVAQKHILIVDDDRDDRIAIKALLGAEGYAVEAVRTGEEALKCFAAGKGLPDLVVLDVNLPGQNGYRICEELRKIDARILILMLSGRASATDQVRGFSAMADDYVVKGGDPAVLLARIRRLLERRALVTVLAEPMGAKLRVGDRMVDVSSLTNTECDLLRILSSDIGRSFTAQELRDALRGKGFVCEDTLLYVHVHNLREKLVALKMTVESVRGQGYRLVT